MKYVLKEHTAISMNPVSTTYECGCYYNEVTGDIDTCDNPEHEGYVPSYDTWYNKQPGRPLGPHDPKNPVCVCDMCQEEMEGY